MDARPLPLFTAGERNVTLYRIPVLLAHGEYRLAFAEARLPCVRSCGGLAPLMRGSRLLRLLTCEL